MGFIKFPDDLTDWAWYGDNNTLIVYVRLRYEAKYRAADVGNVHLERGQVLTSVSGLARKCGVTIRQARTALERLKSTNKIAINSTPQNSIITLLDYDCEGACDKQNDKQTTNQRQAECQTNVKPTTNQRQTNDTASLLKTDRQISRQAESIRAREPAETPVDVKKKNEPEKRKYAEFVSMTNDEYSSLVTKLGEQGAKRCIEILDNYKGQSGKTYKCDYRAILNWVVSRYEEEQTKCRPSSQSKPQGASNSGNPFTDLLRELDEQEAKEIDVPGYSTDYGNS